MATKRVLPKENSPLKTVVLNGSPKGDFSVTRQYIHYLEKIFISQNFQVINIGEDIAKLENNNDYFSRVKHTINEADALVWCYPVYTFLIPYQLKRFIELVEEKNATNCFAGKYATSISTSAHFYDHTAHNYIHQISCDWGMNYLEGFSAAMNDLTKPAERKNLSCFWEDFCSCVQQEAFLEKRYEPVNYSPPYYRPELEDNVPADGAKKVTLLTDHYSEDCNLANMVRNFSLLMPAEVEIIKLQELDLKGGCRGCIRCGYDGTCIYRDDFMKAWQKIIEADAVIYAGTVVDRFLSSRWKLFFDRCFCNGHRPYLMGKQMGYIVSGPLRQIPNLREILQANVEVNRANLVGFVTDEYSSGEDITLLLKNFTSRFATFMENNCVKPQTFRGRGGHLVFRDLIYNMSGIFQEDYRFYRKYNLFDFPQKNINSRFTNAGLKVIMKIPRVRKNIVRKSKEGMIFPHQQVLRRIQK